jgi:hypothetical protein
MVLLKTHCSKNVFLLIIIRCQEIARVQILNDLLQSPGRKIFLKLFISQYFFLNLQNHHCYYEVVIINRANMQRNTKKGNLKKILVSDVFSSC